jgi:hypothetical protein
VAITNVSLDLQDPFSTPDEFQFVVDWGDGTTDVGTMRVVLRNSQLVSYEVSFPTHIIPRDGQAQSRIKVTLHNLETGEVLPWS